MKDSSRLRVLLPVGLFVLALLLRLVGIGWGLKNDLHNQSYHPDELDIWAYSQRIQPAQGQFTPGFYNYGTLYLTTLKIASDVTAAYTGGPNDKDLDATWAYVSRCHEAGRIVNALAGAGTVVLVFLMLRRFIGDLGSSTAALAILVAPGHVVHSRFQTVDVFATFLLAASALFALKLIPGEGDELTPKAARKLIFLAGLFAGLSGGTKYTGVLGLFTLLAVIVVCRKKTQVLDALLAIVATVVGFLVATPGAVLDTGRFLTGVSYEMAHTSTGHGIVFEGTGNGFVYHLGNLMSGMGAIIVVLGLVGLVTAAVRKHVWAWALLAFFVPYYFLIGRAEAKFLRYTFPLYIGIAAGLGYAVSAAHRRGGAARGLVALGILGIGGVDSRGLVGAIQETTFMTGEDPRDQAARYLRANSGPTDFVGLASDPWYWTPPTYKDTNSQRAMPLDKRLAQMAAESQPKTLYYTPPDGKDPFPFDLRLLTQAPNPTWVTYSSFESVPRDRLLGREDVPFDARTVAKQYDAFTKQLKADYNLDRQFGEVRDPVEDMMYIHPAIYVWKRK